MRVSKRDIGKTTYFVRGVRAWIEQIDKFLAIIEYALEEFGRYRREGYEVEPKLRFDYQAYLDHLELYAPLAYEVMAQVELLEFRRTKDKRALCYLAAPDSLLQPLNLYKSLIEAQLEEFTGYDVVQVRFRNAIARR